MYLVQIMMIHQAKMTYRVFYPRFSSRKSSNSLRCIHLHNENWFIQRVIVHLSSSVYPRLNISWATRRVRLEKQKTPNLSMHLVHAPSLLVDVCCVVCIILVILWSFFVCACIPCLVFVPELHSFWFPPESWFPWLLSPEAKDSNQL